MDLSHCEDYKVKEIRAFAKERGIKLRGTRKAEFCKQLQDYFTFHLTFPYDQEMILLIGAPACGKSTFVKKYLRDYKVVSQDLTKTRKKALKLAEEVINEGESIVIDNQNKNIKERSNYINLALDYDIPVRAIYFDVDIDTCKERNKKRPKNKQVPAIVYNVYKKHFEYPELDEGIKKILIYKE